MRRFVLLASLLVATSSSADEGMWPYNMVPKQEVQTKYGVELSDAFLDRAMRATVRFNVGGTGSFVSKDGLVMTNHHVGADCIQKLSQGDNDLMKNGFVAATRGDEKKCPDLELNQLMEIQDVTERVEAAATALGVKAADAEKGKAKKAEMAKIEKECSEGQKMRCDVVTLYAGGAYHLYKYQKYVDVRLVFAPEFEVAFFGGDPENFTYPRTCLDVAFFRVYDENGVAVRTDRSHLPFSKTGAERNQLAFVSGHPGSTGRFSTTSNLKMLRDTAYPFVLGYLGDLRGRLDAYMKQGDAQARAARDDFFGVENSIKAITGFLSGLRDPSLVAEAERRETELKAKVNELADPDKTRIAEAWPKLDAAYASYATFYDRYAVLERQFWTSGTIASIARHLLRLGDELPKKNEERLTEYRDSGLNSLELQLFSSAPIDDGLEVLKLTFALENLTKLLGANDPVMKAVLAGKSPADRAQEIVAGTKLKDVAVRKALKDGGKAAVDKAKDPAIELVRAYDKLGRELRKRYEDQVESVEHTYSGRIAEAWAKVFGSSIYPDATFTLRLNWGVVAGFLDGGKEVSWRTQFGDIYRKHKRANGKEPYVLPQRWQDAMTRVDFSVPFNFVSTNDIIGGNSGSPVFDEKAEVIGLIFDGNLPQLPNRFLYRENTERAVSVHTQAIVHALDKVYRADALVDELGF